MEGVQNVTTSDEQVQTRFFILQAHVFILKSLLMVLDINCKRIVSDSEPF